MHAYCHFRSTTVDSLIDDMIPYAARKLLSKKHGSGCSMQGADMQGADSPTMYAVNSFLNEGISGVPFECTRVAFASFPLARSLKKYSIHLEFSTFCISLISNITLNPELVSA